MKKLLVGLIASFMLVAGLVAVSGSTTATASGVAAPRCYTGRIPTDTQVNAMSPRPRKVRVKASVSAGNKRVRAGKIKVQIKGNNKYRQKIRPAGNVKVSFRMPPGIYLVQAKYKPFRSCFRRSEEAAIVTVKGRRG